ncbi:MAG: DoxX family protein [Myxococcota bacterium]
MRAWTLPFLGRWADVGHLVLRAGVGVMMVTHGWPKLAGGEAVWEKVGRAMGVFGITFAPTLWGFAAAATETFGGALLAIGLATRPAAALLTFTMLVAALSHLSRGQGLGEASHAIELGFVFAGLTFVGGGKYSVDRG